jgi:serine/threonine protein kinase
MIGALIALAAPLVLGGLGLAWTRGRLRKIQTAAQAMRVHALERSLALRETENRSGAGDLEGSVVAGQYRIGPRMGSGASGVIYQATRITDGLPVAIKLLRAATAHDAVASDRLRREAEALGLSWHPNVVEVIDHGHLPDGTSYLVMELLEGEPLANRLKYKGRITVDELFPIAMHVAEAVVAIHAAGVVHRDLKPANLLRSEGGQVKIADFGIARALEETMVTQIGTVLGTMRYLSPEQAEGRVVGTEADVYSLGVVFDELLKDATEDDRTLIARMRSHDAWSRPSAEEVASSFGVTQILPLSRREHRPRFSTRSKVLAAGAAAAIVAALAIATTGGGNHPARVEPVPHATTPAQQARNLSAWLKSYSR